MRKFREMLIRRLESDVSKRVSAYQVEKKILSVRITNYASIPEMDGSPPRAASPAKEKKGKHGEWR